MSDSDAPRRGRRAGTSNTKQQIADAARELFAEHGYSGATMRAIAERAGVDVALIPHYFGNKKQLFMQTIELPFPPEAIVSAISGGDPDTAGERLAAFALRALDTPEVSTRASMLLRSAVTDPSAAQLLQQVMSTHLMPAVAAHITGSDPQRRALLVSSQIMGIAMVRNIMAVPAFRQVDSELLARSIAPTLQRYLTGDIG